MVSVCSVLAGVQLHVVVLTHAALAVPGLVTGPVLLWHVALVGCTVRVCGCTAEAATVLFDVCKGWHGSSYL